MASGALAHARLCGDAQISIDAALYSFNSEELFRCLVEAQNRRVQVRLLTDGSKYEQTELTRELLMDARVPRKLRRTVSASPSLPRCKGGRPLFIARLPSCLTLPP